MRKYYEATTSDKDILKADVMRLLIERKAEDMLQGKNACVLTDVSVLDVQLDIPAATYFSPEKVAEGAKGGMRKLDFFKVRDTMDKYETGFYVTHETKARQQENTQVDFSIDRCARGLAIEKDTEMFTVLKAGSGQNNAAAATWDANDADPASDIAIAIGKIMDNTHITDEDVKNIAIYYPAIMWSQLAKPVDVNGIQKTLRNWAETEYQIKFFPTRLLNTDALAIIKSNETALHLAYTGVDIPRSFFDQDSAGDKYEYTEYFKTIIVPEVDGGTTTNKICKITDVAT